MSLTGLLVPAAARPARRWTASLAVALTLHAASAALLLHWHRGETLLRPLPPAVTLINLAPMPAPPAPAPRPPEPPQPRARVRPPQPEPQLDPPEEAPLAKPPPSKPLFASRHSARPSPRPSPTSPDTAHSPLPASPTPGPSAPPHAATALPRFTDVIAAQLERYKRYPPLAQRRGEQGVAVLRFTLDRTGNAMNARIERSSGHADLDAEVLALLRRAAPLPPIPSDIAANTLDLEVPVSFVLR